MKKPDPASTELPVALKGYVHVLKTQSPALPAAAETRLYQARQAALAHHAAQRSSWWQPSAVLALTGVAHPKRIAGMLVVTVGVVLLATLWLGLSRTDDAVMLGDDFPIDAFVDNGFEPWQHDRSF